MKIKTAAFIVLSFFIAFSAHAQTAALDEINRNIRNEEAALKKLRAEKGAVVRRLELISSKISNYRALIAELDKERVICENKIKKLRSSIVSVSKEISSAKKDIAKSNMFVIDNMGYAEVKVITSSERPSETVKILEILGKAGANLQIKIDKLNKDAERLRELRLEEEVKALELETLYESRKNTVNELNKENARYRSEITMLKHDEAGRLEYIELLKFQRADLDNKIRERTSPHDVNSSYNGGGNPRVKTFGDDKPIEDAMADNSPFGRLVNKLPMPVINGKIIERYGEYIVPEAGVRMMHKGVKISAGSSSVKAVADGSVVFADKVKNFNNLIIIDHGSSYYTVYGNMDAVKVKSGDKIKGGAVLGSIYSAGDTESYLYFEIRKKEQALNPLLWFKKG